MFLANGLSDFKILDKNASVSEHQLPSFGLCTSNLGVEGCKLKIFDGRFKGECRVVFSCVWDAVVVINDDSSELHRCQLG